jgi:predicted kinase
MSRVVLMCGPAGSGKSTLARQLEQQGWVRLSVDVAAWGQGHRSFPLPATVAEAAHQSIREQLLDLVAKDADVVVDLAFWSRRARDEYRSLLADTGVVPEIWYLATPRDVALSRVAARANDGPDSVALPAATAARFYDNFEVPGPDEGPLRIIG